MKGNERKTTTTAAAAAAAASTYLHNGQRVMRPKSNRLLVRNSSLSLSFVLLSFLSHMCDGDINMSTKIETKCVCV